MKKKNNLVIRLLKGVMARAKQKTEKQRTEKKKPKRKFTQNIDLLMAESRVRQGMDSFSVIHALGMAAEAHKRKAEKNVPEKQTKKKK